MSATGVEALMASLYTDRPLLQVFLADPHAALARFDLSARERQSCLAIDKPSLMLAASAFAGKRAKANEWRHASAFASTLYDEAIAPHLLRDAHSVMAKRMASRKAPPLTKLTPAGTTVDLFDALPDGRVDLAHLVLEDSSPHAVASIWQRLSELHLWNHHLLRAFFLRVAAIDCGKAGALHLSAGSYVTYLMLEGPHDAFSVDVKTPKGEWIQESMKPGRLLTLPSDAPQRVSVQPHAPAEPIAEFLCIKTLAL